MKIVIFGLAITSSWGNGHASTYRALCKALHRRGHRIVFFEREQEWYSSNRDLPHPEFCAVRIYQDWAQALPTVRKEVKDCDAIVIGSYFPDAIAAVEELLDRDGLVKAFYDIDTPITVAQLRKTSATDYLRAEHIPEFDLYFSFTGGPLLQELERDYGARRAVPLYCSVDPEKYRPVAVRQDLTCDLSYMGTYAPDRQPKINEFLSAPASRLPERKFIVAGPQFPDEMTWPENVERIIHLNPQWHPAFYSSSRLTLNVTRRDMVMAGYSPSVRLFEAAACGATIISDNWPGLDTFFTPGEEILLPGGAKDVARYVRDYSDAELERIGRAARERVLAEHSSSARAAEFESHVQSARVKFELKMC